MEKLSVSLTAEISNFRANMAAAAGVASSTERSVITAANSISRNIANVNKLNLNGFNQALRSGQLSINQTAQAASRVAPALAAAGNAASKSTTNWTGLSRIIQDLPFGFIGIQNNLSQILPAAGLAGLAISAVVSALTFAQTGTANWTRGLDGNSKALKKVKGDTEEYISALDDVTEAQLRGSQSAQREITELASLYRISTDVTQSMEDRNAAVDEIQRKYPDYFKNIDDETIKAGGAQSAYDKLTNSILATARARAAQDLITKNSSRMLEDEQKILDLRQKQQEALNKERELERKIAQQGRVLGGGTLGATGANQNTNEAALLRIRGERVALDTQINNLSTDYLTLQERNLRLETQITDQVKKGADLTEQQGEGRTKQVKTLADVMKELDTSLLQVDNSFNTTFGERANSKIQAYQRAYDELLKLGLKPTEQALIDIRKAQQDLVQLPISPITDLPTPGKLPTIKGDISYSIPNIKNQVTKQQTEILKAQEQFNQDFAQLVNGGFLNSVGAIGENIGEALATGGSVIQAAGNALLKGFSQFLSNFGDLLIEYGAAAVLKAKLDIAAFIPGAGIAAGIAAIAAGIALKVAAGAINSFGNRQNGRGVESSRSNVTAFANGGIVSGPTLGLMGEYAGASRNPEVIAPLDKLRNLMGLDGNGSGAGANGVSIELIPEVRMDLEQLVFGLRRVEKRLNRIG